MRSALLICFSNWRTPLSRVYLSIIVSRAALVKVGFSPTAVNPWHQVALGYLNLLLGDVATDLYNLHAVKQRPGNGVELVGSGYEHGLGQVVVHVEVVVVEGVVLLGVEHLKKRRGGVAVERILCYLVYLVKDKHGVRRASFLDALDDTAGHSPDVGTTVTAYLGLVMETTQ